MKQLKKKLLSFACVAATVSLLSVPSAAVTVRFAGGNNNNCVRNGVECAGQNNCTNSNRNQMLNSIFGIYSNMTQGQNCQRPSCPVGPNCDNNQKPDWPDCPDYPIYPDTPAPDDTPDQNPDYPDYPDFPVYPDGDWDQYPDQGEKPDDNQKPDQEPDQNPGENPPLSAYAEEVLRLVNQERTAAGLNPVTLSAKAQAAAQVRAKEIKTSFSHTRPDGTSCFTALKDQNLSYRTAGENIAWGQSSPAQVMDGWMNSSGHRANILSKNFTQMGVGVYQDFNGALYWTQMFIS